ncbi:hypothetical protein DEDE109153_07585 [Deinococcus deserti]|uniref:Copper amine oxidase-like N-terminal domain-containing protein n=1 Tax=Deinococcus deserti (strain DSM 17065 / CIP 109153 / LMG 22923 / VCD115) TaxID=546414 RepID=C1CWG0_DEIDV|nr:hypothetical protein [Deinococcus deserti]ACO46527.1 Hypothetical protein, precursor [Deinococcus deserti VCD115]
MIQQGKRRAVLGVLVLGMALAQSQNSWTVVINGRPAPGRAIVVDGKTYVPLDALRAVGVTAATAQGTLNLTLPGAARPATTPQAPGGANQVAAVEGCIGDQLFNGVLRLRVQKVEDLGRQWGVTVEVRNGTSKRISTTAATGIDIYSEELSLATTDGNTLTHSSAGDAWSLAIRQALPPGGGFVVRKEFEKRGEGKPQKLVFVLDPRSKGRDTSLRYTVADPSFRVRLDCQR